MLGLTEMGLVRGGLLGISARSRVSTLRNRSDAELSAAWRARC